MSAQHTDPLADPPYNNRSPLLGIHHVTAIAGDPQENLDFYMGTLGLRLVKRSVNQDDPGTYHLFYADAVGTPGTDLTFFASPRGPRGHPGFGQATAVALAVPARSLTYWMQRLADHSIAFEGPLRKFGEETLAFLDVHGLALELVAADDSASRPWEFWAGGPVPLEHAIRGIHSVTLTTASQATTSFLTTALGFRPVAEDGQSKRLAIGKGGSGAWLDLLVSPTSPRGRTAVGTIHHVAWRTPDPDEQRLWWQRIRSLGTPVSDLIDRFWFRSIYFREAGGALFEIATDGPGFGVDEPLGELGARLVLPPWLEPRRSEIERALLPIRLPHAAGQAEARLQSR